MKDNGNSSERYSELSTGELIALLCRYGARVPLALAQEIVSRGSEAVPELCRIVSSQQRWRDERSAAAIHAMHLLGAIGDPAAAESLLAPLCWNEPSDFITDNLPGVLARLGPSAIPALRDFVHNSTQDSILRAVVYSGLVGMAILRPELEVQVRMIGRQLAIRCVIQEEPFPAPVALDLAEYQDPRDLELLEHLYRSDLWDDDGILPWHEVLEAFEEGRLETEAEVATRDPMDYFAPEEQARLAELWHEWRRR